MTRGPIRRLARERIVRRDDARLPTAWVGQPEPVAVASRGTWLEPLSQRESYGSTEAEDRLPALVFLRDPHRALHFHIAARVDSGQRVYALVPSGWQLSDLGQHVDNATTGPTVLFRRVPEVPCSGVFTGGEAWLALGRPDGGAWRLTLDPAQAASLRQVFLRCFWHEATEEAWIDGQQARWHAVGERPFDVPGLPPDPPLRLAPPDARLDVPSQGALVHLAAGPPPDDTPSKLWLPVGPDQHERLSRLVRAGTTVLWDDRGLPDIAVGPVGGEMLLPGTRSRVRIRLTPPQVADATRILSTPAQWQFGVDVLLGDPAVQASSFWLPGEAAARRIEQEQAMVVPDVPAPTLRAVPETSPSTLPDPQPLALTARYTWTVVPPRVPAGTEEDAVIGRWKRIDEDWAARLARLRDALQAVEDARGRVRKAFSRLASAMLGFERTSSGLLSQVASMEAQRPSAAGPTRTSDLLDRLAKIEEQTRKLQGDLDEAEREAREDEERERQEAAWRARVEAAKRDLAARQAELTQAEERRGAITSDLASAEEAANAADKEARRDILARQRKLSDDLAKLNKDIKRLRGEVPDLQERVAERFEFKPTMSPTARPAQPGGRFVPPSSGARSAAQVPEESLPEVGSLRSLKGQRYLVIETWEDLTAGEKAATRLSARLVAPEKA